jgi:hypothetical protein
MSRAAIKLPIAAILRDDEAEKHGPSASLPTDRWRRRRIDSTSSISAGSTLTADLHLSVAATDDAQ